MHVLLLDDDDDLRYTIAEVISLLAREKHCCLPISSYAELISRKNEVLRTDLALLDINLGVNAPSGIDAEAWLRENRYQGRVAFLTGHAYDHPLVKKAQEKNATIILEKPISAESLLALIEPEPFERSA